MNVLVACEYSGMVRDAFSKEGHLAVSCDILPTESDGFHFHGDVRHINPVTAFDLLIAFPPCTHLCSSGARWFAEKRADGRQQEALELVKFLWEAPIKRIAIENPIGILSTELRKPDQIIQPWQYGHGETKATCLWLKGLPKLTPTCIVEGREARIHRMAPSPDRSKLRSLTYPGIAKAMAEQWGRGEE